MASKQEKLAALKAKMAIPAPDPTPSAPPAPDPTPHALPATETPILREPTQESAPILGPALTPIAYAFARTPHPAHLSGGQKAALTRAANKAAGIAGGGGAPRATGNSERQAVTPARPTALRLRVTADRITATLVYLGEDGRAMTTGSVPAPERGILRFFVQAYVRADDTTREITGFRHTRLVAAEHEATALEQTLAAMRRTDAIIANAIAESDDNSFPQVIATLATVYRVTAIQILDGDATAEPTIVKRGAGYVTTLRLCDAMQTRAT